MTSVKSHLHELLNLQRLTKSTNALKLQLKLDFQSMKFSLVLVKTSTEQQWCSSKQKTERKPFLV